MTVKDVMNEIKICECTINELRDMQDKAWSEDSDTIQDAISIIVKYVDELEEKQIK